MVKNPYQTLISLGVPESVVANPAPPSAAMATASTSTVSGLSIS